MFPLSLEYATSYGRCSHNENGDEEVNAEFAKTLWQWLMRQPPTKRVWFRVGDYWYRKEDGKLASDKDHAFIATLLYRINMNRM